MAKDMFKAIDQDGDAFMSRSEMAPILTSPPAKARGVIGIAITPVCARMMPFSQQLVVPQRRRSSILWIKMAMTSSPWRR